MDDLTRLLHHCYNKTGDHLTFLIRLAGVLSALCERYNFGPELQSALKNRFGIQ